MIGRFSFSSMSTQCVARPLHRRSTPCLLLVLLALCQLSVAAKSPPPQPYARQFTGFALKSCDRVQGNLREITRVAEIIADRHIKGGLIGFIGNGQGLPEELIGRSGGIMHIGFDRPWSKEPRTPEQEANNVALIGWDRAPDAAQLDSTNATIKKMHDAGTYIIGFGPRGNPALAAQVPLCNVWFDTGLGADDRVVVLPKGARAGHANLLVNMLNGWSLTAEIVSALTRRGKMPTMWKSYMTEDGMAWGNKYFGKMQFHDDYTIAPIPQGKLARDFLNAIRTNIRWFEMTQLPSIGKAADLISNEWGQGRKTVVATAGHAPYTFVSKTEDAAWGAGRDLYTEIESMVKDYRAQTSEGALVLRLGYTGMHKDEVALFEEKKQRVMLITSLNPRPEWQIPKDKLVDFIDMGWAYGDAAVSIPGYPIRVFAPSGIMQIVAYEAVNVEVLAHGPAANTPVAAVPRTLALAELVPSKGTAILDYKPPRANLPAGFTIRHPKDGAEMVWVPAGYFRMGINADTAKQQAAQLEYKDYHEIAAQESFPEHMVYVEGFYIDKYEVTRERWKQFIDANPGWKQQAKGGPTQPTWTGPELKPEEAKLPIAEVTWQAAQQYANWAGKQLPTEAMWEKAARGTDGRWYPWGNEKPSKEYGVISMGDALPGPEPVGSYPKGASPYGAMDMAGNVYEWTSNWVEPYPNNPEPEGGAWGHQYAIVRGGSFYHTRHTYRTAKRMGFEYNETYFHVGFRTAWYPPADFDDQKYAVK